MFAYFANKMYRRHPTHMCLVCVYYNSLNEHIIVFLHSYSVSNDIKYKVNDGVMKLISQIINMSFFKISETFYNIAFEAFSG